MQPLVVCQACTSIALTIQTGLESLGLSHKVKGWPDLGGAGPCEGGTLGVVPQAQFPLSLGPLTTPLPYPGPFSLLYPAPWWPGYLISVRESPTPAEPLLELTTAPRHGGTKVLGLP